MYCSILCVSQCVCIVRTCICICESVLKVLTCTCMYVLHTFYIGICICTYIHSYLCMCNTCVCMYIHMYVCIILVYNTYMYIRSSTTYCMYACICII